ncbi:MAG: recombinase family protein [Clostridia bacterium]|nr:recombinase family protein [Clostridia bacterium]
MNETEKKIESTVVLKDKIRQRYKGIDFDELDFIPALPQASIMEDSSLKRIAVYVRVSTDDPRQTSSYELQKNHYMDVIKRHPNWVLVEIYADEGISGTSLKHRDAFLRMIEDCKAGKIDIILTKSVSRFARNIVDCISYQRELKSLNPPVGIMFETEGIFTLNANSEMSLSFIATLAQEESHTKSEIMNSSIEMRFRRGIFLTPTLLGYDHDEEGNLVVNEEEAKTVRLIFYLYLSGYSTAEIAETLSTLKRKTKKGNTRWSTGSILQILQNERHCGDVLARKTFTPNYLDHKSKKNKQDRNQYRKRDHHEPLISRDDFIAVQHMISNAKYGNKEILPTLHVIDKGILTGFVPIHPRWAGFSSSDYINASRSIPMDVEMINDTIEANEGEFDLRGFEIAHAEFFQTKDKMAVTFSPDSITFGIIGIRKMDNIQYIDILIHPEKKLLAVRKAKKDSKYSYQWARQHNGNIVAKTISATSFMPMLYELLSWDTNNKYRATGYKKQKDKDSFLLFDLKDTEIIIPSSHNMDEELSPLTTGKNSIIAYPAKWAEGFGEEYYAAMNQNLNIDEWHTEEPGTPFETTDLNVSTPEQIRQNLTEILHELGGNHG